MSSRPHTYKAAMVRALVQPDEEQSAIKVLTNAFHTDPLSTALNPDPARRTGSWLRIAAVALASQPPSGFVHTITALSRSRSSEASQTEESNNNIDLAAVAIWTPKTIDYAESHEYDQNLSPAAVRFLEAVKAAGPPKPHMYLGFLGSSDQGNGAASALLTRGIADSRDMGFESVALWTGNQRNLAFYERFGFAMTQRVAAAGFEGWWLRKSLRDN